MGFLGKVFNFSMGQSHDTAAIMDAVDVWKNYKAREAEASEDERKQADEALAFLKQSGNDPT